MTGDEPDQKRGPIVTLDGPAGSGKSTTAKAVAQRLGFRHLDSGALYRALTLALLEAAIPEDRWDDLTEHDMTALDVRVTSSGTSFDVLVGGRVVRDELRSRDVTARVPKLAALAPSRASLLSLQRSAGAEGGLVADGRDMGSVVYPHADVKVYLVADLEQRARRRLLEVGVEDPSEDQVAEQAATIAARDRQDSEREHSPLRKPEDAHLIDTTRLDFEQQVAAIEALVRDLDGRG
ncbi:MAG: (d)CMP kinase [Gemmatimonadota bacterium]